MGQPVDTSRNWIPIPPLPADLGGNLQNNLLYVVVSNERLDAAALAGSLCNFILIFDL